MVPDDQLRLLFKDLADFLANLSSLYNFSNIKVFQREIRDVLDRSKWRSVLLDKSDIRRFFRSDAPLMNPETPLGTLVANRRQLLLRLRNYFNREAFVDAAPHNRTRNAKVGAKKLYEIVISAAHLKRVMADRDVQTVIDVGSGVGQLAQELLANNKTFKVVCVECDKKLSDQARDKLDKDRAQVIQGRLEDPDTQDALRARLEREERVGLVGLHACGDLTPAMIRLMFKTPKIDFVAAFSCCYHKQKDRDNLPLSDFAQCNLTQDQKSVLFSAYASRLASQECLESWLEMSDRELEDRARFLASRAALEKLAHDEGITLKKHKRRAARKAHLNDSLVEKLLDGYEFEACQLAAEELEQKLEYEVNESLAKHGFLKNLVTLQLSLQVLMEYLYILDRAIFVRENGCDFELCEAFCQTISPRNKLLICYKR